MNYFIIGQLIELRNKSGQTAEMVFLIDTEIDKLRKERKTK